MRQLSYFSLAIVALGWGSQVSAADFNLPFVNSAGLGVAYANWATAYEDASTAYTNPAGLVKLPHQQVVVNALGLTGTASFTGSARTPSFPFPAPIIQSGVARSGINAFMPSFYYATPLTQRLSLGFNVTTPFGLGTNYGSTPDVITRYAATRSQVIGTDIGPSLGVKITEKIAVGAGFDALRLAFTLNNKYGPPLSLMGDSTLKNHLTGWGYGWHAGALLDATSTTRIGFSFNSMIAIHTTGHSTVYAPSGSALFRTADQKTDAALPARAQLTLHHDFTPRWAGMATVFYTNWRTFNQIKMKQTQTPSGIPTSVTIPFNYHNCFDYSLGATFKATSKWLLRGGIQLMSTPSNNQDRGVADPIGSATVVALGAHFQAAESLGFDFGVGHSFFRQMPINYTGQLTALQGHTNAQTTVIGGQINWGFA